MQFRSRSFSGKTNLFILFLTASTVGIFVAVLIWPILIDSHQIGMRKNGACQVHFIDVGMGDSALVITPDKRTILIDTGSVGSGITNYIKSQDLVKLDLVIITHDHEDHIGGLNEVVKSIKVREVITNKYPETLNSIRNQIKDTSNPNIEIQSVTQGSKVTLSDIFIEVLSPSSDYQYGDINETSLVVRMVCGGVSFLFTGDAGETSEYLIRQNGLDPRSDVLKIGHHGSTGSTSPEFLDIVKPALAIISVGNPNDLGLPNAEVLDRLNLSGIKILRTDLSGNIILTAADHRYWVTTQR